MLPHYRVLTSKFRVVQSFDDVDKPDVKIKFVPNTKMNHIDDAKNIDDSCFEETTYRIKFRVEQSFDIHDKLVKIKFVPKTKRNHIKERTYRINEQGTTRVPYTKSSVEKVILRIDCWNGKLFGDGVVWIQQFDAPEPPVRERFFDYGNR